MSEKRTTGGATATASPDLKDDAHDEDADRPGRTGDPSDERKHEVLSHNQASTVRSISDAVVIKDGEPFFLCPPDGQIPMDGDHGYGLYQHDTRFLSGYELRIHDVAPDSLAATAAAGTTAILELTNPAIHLENDRTIGKAQLAVRWTRALDGTKAELRDRVEIRNHDSDDVTLSIRVDLAAGFQDIFEIRGLLVPSQGSEHDPEWDGDSLRFAYDGRDGVVRSLTATFDPKPASRQKVGATFELGVPGRGVAGFTITFRMGEDVQPGAAPIERRFPTRTTQRRPKGGSSDEASATSNGGTWRTSVASSSLLLDAVLGRSFDDLDLLRGELDGLDYYAAGLPWFSTLFGRDSLIAAYQTLAFDQATAADTLRLLAGRQGTTVDAWRDEQPGKILHELRIGELARNDEIPQTPYYGSVDSTPLFLIVLAEHAAWTGNLDLFHELADNVDRALDWIDRYGDADGDGYIEYSSASKGGLANQGWKDSGDSMVDAHGRIAKPPILLAEVQGYMYLAWRRVADLFERDGQGDRATTLRDRAETLRTSFERDFWSDDLGAYAMALEQEHRPLAVMSSNAGQVLLSGIATTEHAKAVAARLLAEDMFNGWGIRTISSEAVAYNPIGYHLGTVWPHDNSLIAAGLRTYGLDGDVATILTSLVEAAADFEHNRLPECFAGIERSAFEIPVRYPVACHPQAWAAGSIPHLLTLTLGLLPEALDGRLRIVRPHLPAILRDVEVRNLAVAGAEVDLDFHRADGSTEVVVKDVRGRLDIRIEGTDASPDGRNR
ncbi:MAG TPA: glycogen debranching N-terminal domain-containing protein [Candidatus Limnocylindrales bacterium]|nr:glycogen debranching N-terminal domain-containing protein [Candidatus Limnocylindrales bacterium]